MPLAIQSALLGAIERREVVRLGSSQPRALDVRVVAATSADLLARSAEGAFRLDLLYRLNGISIVIPPLRERTGEITRLAVKFIGEAAARAGRPKPRLSNEALGVLVHHPFFGNIRELRNTMERACVVATTGFIGPEHLLFESPAARGGGSRAPVSDAAPRARVAPIGQTEAPDAPPDALAPIVIPPPPSTPSGIETPRFPMSGLERDRIVAALEECKGNQTRAAEVLGMSRRVLIARIEQYGLPRPRKR
jgi:DNA-binding NtrC family response regulator